MKIGITYRLFFSILAATCLAVLSMFLIMQWSINRGFLRYISSVEQERMEQLAERLEESYAEHGSWDFLRERPRFRIMQLLSERPDEAVDESLRESGRRHHLRPVRPMRAHRPGMPFVVLDAERNALFGNAAEVKDENLRPLIHGSETVGYIGLPSPRHFLNPRQFEFLKGQKSALILAAFGMALVVAIFSLPLAGRMVRPIRAMAEATRELASGKYSVRVPVSSSDEVGQLARDFNAMALTLEKNEKARRQWVADISHELRTPLSVLRGEIEALMEGVRTVTPDAVRSLHAETLRLSRLVDDLYQLALSDLGALTYRKEDLDLAETLRASVESYSEEFVRKGIALYTDISQGLRTLVFADAERMNQLFSNLLDNSLKYTDSGGKLVIRLTCHDGRASVDFEDSSPGVTGSEMEKLFDRLFRVEGSRSRASGGAGLGLAICRNIAEAHSGTISAHPSPSGGVLIKVTLPVAGECS
jgi:two-component system sensor histidine kinase BaeS